YVPPPPLDTALPQQPPVSYAPMPPTSEQTPPVYTPTPNYLPPTVTSVPMDSGRDTSTTMVLPQPRRSTTSPSPRLDTSVPKRDTSSAVTPPKDTSKPPRDTGAGTTHDSTGPVAVSPPDSTSRS